MTVVNTRSKSKSCLFYRLLQGLLVLVVALLEPNWMSSASAQGAPNLFFPQLNPQASPPGMPPNTSSRLRSPDPELRFSFRNEPGLMLKNQEDTSDSDLVTESQRQAERRGAWIVPTLYALGGILTLSGLYVMLREESEDTPPVRVRIFPGFSGGGAQANINIRF